MPLPMKRELACVTLSGAPALVCRRERNKSSGEVGEGGADCRQQPTTAHSRPTRVFDGKENVPCNQSARRKNYIGYIETSERNTKGDIQETTQAQSGVESVKRTFWSIHCAG
jgi:hypothetical protein